MKLEEQALELIFNIAGVDGVHHKDWLIDQVVRVLTGDDYDNWIRRFKDGEDVVILMTGIQE